MGEYSWIIAGFVAMIIGAIVISKAKRKAKRCCAPAVATITRVDRVQKTNDKGQNMKGYDYTPWFTYTVDGLNYEKQADCSTSNKNEFTVGAQLSVLYNPGNPEEVQIAGKSAKSEKAFGIVLLLLGVVIMLVGSLKGAA